MTQVISAAATGHSSHLPEHAPRNGCANVKNKQKKITRYARELPERPLSPEPVLQVKKKQGKRKVVAGFLVKVLGRKMGGRWRPRRERDRGKSWIPIISDNVCAARRWTTRGIPVCRVTLGMRCAGIVRYNALRCAALQPLRYGAYSVETRETSIANTETFVVMASMNLVTAVVL